MVKQSHLEPSNLLVLVLVSMAFVVVVLGLSGALFCMRRRSGYELKEKLVGMATDTGNDATATYQVRAGVSASDSDWLIDLLSGCDVTGRSRRLGIKSDPVRIERWDRRRILIGQFGDVFIIAFILLDVI